MDFAELMAKIGFTVDEASVQKVNQTVNSIKGMVGKALGMIGVGFTLKGLNAAVEQFRSINLSLESALGNIGNMDEVQNKILRTSKDVVGNYEDIAKNVGDLVKKNRTLFDIDNAVRFTDVMTKLTKLSGGSNGDASSLVSGMASAMKNGKVDSGTIETLFAKAPEAIKILTEYYGVSEQKLRTMAQAGILKAKDIQKAFLDTGQAIDQRFSALSPKLSDVLSSSGSQLKQFVSETDKLLGVVGTIAGFLQKAFQFVMRGLQKIRSGLVFLTEKLGGTANMLKLLGIMATALNFSKIVDGIKGLTGAFTTLGAKGMAVVGIIALILLAIEDFVGFMQGKNSLIGRVFEKMGLDQDEMRDKIVGTWGEIKDFFQNTLQKISGWFSENGPTILKTVSGIVREVSKLIRRISSTIKSWWDENGAGLMQKVGTLFTTIKDDLIAAGEAISEWWDQHGDQVFELVTGAFTGLMNAVDGTVDILSDLWDILVKLIQGDYEGALSGLKDLFGDIGETVKNTLAPIFDTELGQQFIEWGKNLIHNLITGLTQQIAAARQVLEGASNTIRAFFGLDPIDYELESEEERIEKISKSQSLYKKRYEEHPEEVVGTWQYNQAQSEKAEKNLKLYTIGNDTPINASEWESFKEAFVSGVENMGYLGTTAQVDPRTVGSSVDSHNVSTEIYQTNNFTNSFFGDSAGQEQSSRAMNKAAKDSTEEMHRMLMFAR